jgi:hypothetical protein
MRRPIPPLRRTASAAAGLVSGAAGNLAIGVLDMVLDPSLIDEAIDRVSFRVLESPQLERLVAGVIDNPATERLVALAIESCVVDQIVAPLLENEETWLAIEEMVRQGSGDADGWLEPVAPRVRLPR